MKLNWPNIRTRLIYLLLGVIALIAVQGRSAIAQSQAPSTQKSEVEQLKERLQQLEQTVQELKTQINAIEEKNPPSTAAGETISAPAEVAATAEKPEQDDEKKRGKHV
jgi:cell division protein FtsB